MKTQRIMDFKTLVEHVAARAERKRVAVVWAADLHSQEAVAEALRLGIVEVVFVGAREWIEKNPVLATLSDKWTYVDAANADDAAKLAVRLCREGGAEVLMKGLINTDNLLKAVLDKENGLLPKGRVMTHITATSLPVYKKLLFFTDPAVIPYPTPVQRAEQVRYVIDICRRLGVEEPKVSLIHCTEKVNEKHFPFTVDYTYLIADAAEGKFGSCIVDGPLDVKTSVDAEAMRTKGINSKIDGEADALVFPDIISGNVFYKTISLFPGVETAAMLVGPQVPVVLTSRGDSMLTKLYSIALASI